MPDVEMIEEKKEQSQQEIDKISLEDIKDQLKQIEKSVVNKEPRYLSRVLRSLGSTRKKLNETILSNLLSSFSQSGTKAALAEFIIRQPDTSEEKLSTGKKSFVQLLPEIDAYIHLLCIVYLIDTKSYEKAISCADNLTQKVACHNRRTLDPLSAVCYFYYARAYELLDRLKDIRPFLHARLRTATLRHDNDGQVMLLNLLMRNYIHYNLYDQAEKLASKSTFPESASNNDWARYLYYMGLIKAIQLDYSEAHKNLMNAVRKAPQHVAIGFKQHVNRLAIVVQLLLGEIPDRKTFREAILKKTLVPYYSLTQAVRTGNLSMFNMVVEQYKEKFLAEKTYTLIIRLRHNVIKTGVRMISLSYSRISLNDIAQKLSLDSADDAEFIVSKAIRDGVIDASIDHEQKCVQSKETVDVYSTSEPQHAFHQRISFSLDIYNQSVKAMRYPAKSYNKDLESLEEQREREKQDLEYAKEIAEDDEEFP
ncbi:26S proteasome non-ATPase regulatory subunit 3-like isoform X2 [Hydractinia symbiolongicarpus]|uniref:26S proteasome non-ATPase regulatory subunit 3-like isoform X2 n=1 Tax=Hydractinia symbiolongicarpus TaxID=13093 RepID=UPI00254C311A|nr:26S proteasome non-ATPase regulatory subunit 3-like isoform X2 [Hydractinia symbiolongicarpus]